MSMEIDFWVDRRDVKIEKNLEIVLLEKKLILEILFYII